MKKRTLAKHLSNMLTMIDNIGIGAVQVGSDYFKAREAGRKFDAKSDPVLPDEDDSEDAPVELEDIVDEGVHFKTISIKIREGEDVVLSVGPGTRIDGYVIVPREEWKQLKAEKQPDYLTVAEVEACVAGMPGGTTFFKESIGYHNLAMAIQRLLLAKLGYK